jgi:hypothetical protein
MLPDSSQKWGQNGSSSPEKNAVTYVGIAAILTWTFASLLALSKLLGALIAFWRERHPGVS